MVQHSGLNNTHMWKDTHVSHTHESRDIHVPSHVHTLTHRSVAQKSV